MLPDDSQEFEGGFCFSVSAATGQRTGKASKIEERDCVIFVHGMNDFIRDTKGNE